MTENAEMEYFETQMDRMERERQAQQAALEVAKVNADAQVRAAKLQARTATKDMFTYISIAIIAVGMVLGLAYMVWQGTSGPSSSQILEDKWRSQCEGVWIPEASDGSTKAMCIPTGVTTPSE